MSQTVAQRREELAQTLNQMISRLSGAVETPEIQEARKLALEMRDVVTTPVRVALGGEFSAGKSTLTKMLLGHHFVKMQASASSMPTACFKYSSTPYFRVFTGNDMRPIAHPDDMTEQEMRDAECLEVGLDVPFLKHFEIFDTPGTSDPTRDVDQLLKIAENVDLVIWCTNATQAWRESERRMWAELPDDVKSRSLLAVTHVDLPNVKASLDRLMARLNREAGSLFDKIIPMDLLSAVKARDADSVVVDKEAWMKSGGAICIGALEAIAEKNESEAVATVETIVATKIEPVVAKLSAAKPKLSLVSGQEVYPEIKFQQFWSQQMDSVLKSNTGNPTSSSQEFLDLIEASTVFAQRLTTAETKMNVIIDRLAEAREYITEWMRKGNNATGAEDPSAVIQQIDWEFRRMEMLS